VAQGMLAGAAAAEAGSGLAGRPAIGSDAQAD
jgi:hypothetical protein